MFLEKIQLNGFKSFAQPTELRFTKGITAVVGPNGSGKSNIADAIRWVLGEQSMKMIRGKKSEDVIFAGSDKKSRLGMAEVSLFLNNNDGQVPIDFSELFITRRFYRSGEGEYLLNGGKVRLSDIQLLLAQAGIGQRSYAVIGQGQIDQVIVATPSERKAFFDEATGVRQFQIKREQALSKLEKTWENLQQGLVLLEEIEPRLRSLTRQVKRLERKEEIEKELRKWQEFYYYQRWQDLYTNKQELVSKKKVLTQQREGLQQELAKWQNKIESLQVKDEHGSKINTLQRQYDQLQQQKQQLMRKLALVEGEEDKQLAVQYGYDHVWAKQKIEELHLAKKKIEEELQENNKLIKEAEGKIKELQDRQRQIEKEWQKLNNLIKQTDEERRDEANRIITTTLQEITSEVDFIISSNLSAEEIKSKLEGIKNKLNTIQIKWQEQIGGADLADQKKQWDDLEKIIASKEEVIKQITDKQSLLQSVKTKIKWQNDQLDKIKTEIAELSAFTVANEKNNNSKVDISAKENLQKQLRDIEAKLKKVYEEIGSFHRQEQDKRDELISWQNKIRDQQDKIREVDNLLHHLEIELTKLETRLEDLSLTVHQELGELLPVLLEKWQGNKPSVEGDCPLDQVWQKIEDLKKKKELIGGIDPEVVTEYQEVKERFDFLHGQVDDLQEAVKKLENVIKELDEVINHQFSANFRQINKLFAHYFKTLFGGGKAELVLLRADEVEDEEGDEEENNVDAVARVKNKWKKNQFGIIGVDIKAIPPGKKMKGVDMLSGGERAMTSIALICAIIANNPSPFIVLDEVDAALDEANSIRFAEIISELSNKTQFIVITHNRATMEKADILYGVTMGRDGVSHLLSVKFEEAERYANRY